MYVCSQNNHTHLVSSRTLNNVFMCHVTGYTAHLHKRFIAHEHASKESLPQASHLYLFHPFLPFHVQPLLQLSLRRLTCPEIVAGQFSSQKHFWSSHFCCKKEDTLRSCAPQPHLQGSKGYPRGSTWPVSLICRKTP